MMRITDDTTDLEIALDLCDYDLRDLPTTQRYANAVAMICQIQNAIDDGAESFERARELDSRISSRVLWAAVVAA